MRQKMNNFKNDEAFKVQIYKFTLGLFFLLCAPVAIIYLFEDGFWMSLSMFLYFGFWGGLFSFVETFFPQLRKKSSSFENRSLSMCVSVSVCLQLLLILVSFFPFAMMSKNFINWINIIFTLEFRTSYEGGIIVSIFTLGVISTSIYIFVMFCNSVNSKNKEMKHGIFAFIAILVLFTAFSFVKIHNSKPEDNQFIQSQKEIEDRQLDQDIQQYRMQKYKKYSDHEY